jgi:membrane-associated phospholipid phosphatase
MAPAGVRGTTREILSHVARAVFARLKLPDVLLWIGTASASVFIVVSLMAVRHGVFDLDRKADAVVGLTRHAWLHGSMETVSLLGQGTTLVPLIALASLLVWRHRRRWAVALPVVMAGAGGLQLLAKWAVDRPRPNAAPWGFPSGHALIVVVFFGIVAYLMWTSRTGRCWRCATFALCAATVLAVGFSRMYLDMHWLSDVGGGFAIGFGYLLFTIRLVELVPAPARVTRRPTSEDAPLTAS